MLPARKASLSLPQLLFSFLIKMFQMGDSCSHSIFSYSFWQMQPKPYLYLLLFMLGLCNFELAIKADFIFLQNVLGIHPNPQAKLKFVFLLKRGLLSSSKFTLKWQKSVFYKVYLRPWFLLSKCLQLQLWFVGSGRGILEKRKKAIPQWGQNYHKSQIHTRIKMLHVPVFHFNRRSTTFHGLLQWTRGIVSVS